MTARIAFINMTAECGCAAAFDGAHHLKLRDG